MGRRYFVDDAAGIHGMGLTATQHATLLFPSAALAADGASHLHITWSSRYSRDLVRTPLHHGTMRVAMTRRCDGRASFCAALPEKLDELTRILC